MRIGYVIHRFPWPSETFISREVADLIALGHDIRLYAFVRPTGKDEELLSDQARALMAQTRYITPKEAMLALPSLDTLNMLGEERRLAATPTSRTNRPGRLGRAAALAKLARADGLDRLHAHWPYATSCVHLASVATGIDYSISVHAHEVAHDNGHFPVCFERLRFASFCNRAAMEHLLAKLPPQARDKAHLVYHGVDVSAFPFQPPAPPPPPLKVLSAGRLTASKGFDRLVAGCAEAARRGLNVELTILGRGAETEALTAQAASLGFSDRFHLPGWVPHGEVRGYIRDSHAFALLASDDFNDGLPNVVVEAMASGRPVIVSPLPAAREIVDHGKNGFVLDAVDDLEGLIRILNTLAAEGATDDMAQAARRTVVEGYDAANLIKLQSRLLLDGAT